MRILNQIITLMVIGVFAVTAQANSTTEHHFFTNKTINESNYYMPPTEVCDNGLDDDGDGFVDCDDLDCVAICSGEVNYCESEGANNYFEWIEKVKMNSFDFESGQGFGYDDFSVLEVELASESVVNISLKPGYVGNTYEEFWSVWIDLNKDGDFEDANELVFRESLNGELVGSFYVPTVTEEIVTKMRVSMKYESYSDCCGEIDFGEIEDYTVILLPLNYYPEVCTPTDNVVGDWIEKVTCENIDNQSGHNQGYADFSNLSTALQRSEVYDITLDPGFVIGNSMKYWSVWIDLNQDGLFQGKFELVVDTKSSNTIFTSFVVPPIGLIGNTKMRIVMSNMPDADPCAPGFNGEVEDYSVEILALANFVRVIEDEVASSKPVEIPQPVVTIYPNPSTNFVNVDASTSEVALKTIMIFSVEGRMMEHRQITDISTTNIRLDQYDKGNYYMVVIDENNQPTYHNFAILK